MTGNQAYDKRVLAIFMFVRSFCCLVCSTEIRLFVQICKAHLTVEGYAGQPSSGKLYIESRELDIVRASRGSKLSGVVQLEEFAIDRQSGTNCES